MLKTYTIATGNYDTTQAAAEILDQGGNAYDAVLAALFMSFVCEPLLSSPGGGGYLLANAKGKAPQIYDFFAQTPQNKSISKKDFYPIVGDFGATQQEFHIGMAAAAVPGIPAGVFAIHQQYGSLPLIKIAGSAIKKANQGMIVDKLHAEVIQILTPILNHSDEAKAIFSNTQHQLLTEGETKPNPKLAQFLKNLATQPKDWFYRSAPAQNIVADMNSHGGLLNLQDFELYQVYIREPLIVDIRDWKIITNSAPTSGGYLITEQLKQAAKSKNTDANTKLIEAMIYADQLKNQETFQSSKGTTHMSVIDGEGNVASLTVSNGEGCGYMVPNSGFMLNNFLGEEDINSGGFFKFKENSRMASMMSPTVLEQPGNTIALGTGGSNRIKTALFQVIWHLIDENDTLKQAIDQPRFHFENNTLDIEYGFNKSTINQLTNLYINTTKWQNRSLYFGGVNAVQHGETNFAIGDSRRNGVGLVKHLKF